MNPIKEKQKCRRNNYSYIIFHLIIFFKIYYTSLIFYFGEILVSAWVHKLLIFVYIYKWAFMDFWAFMDLEKAYDTIDRHGMWQMLRVYGVGGKLLKAVQSFYEDAIGRVSGWEVM